MGALHLLAHAAEDTIFERIAIQLGKHIMQLHHGNRLRSQFVVFVNDHRHRVDIMQAGAAQLHHPSPATVVVVGDMLAHDIVVDHGLDNLVHAWHAHNTDIIHQRRITTECIQLLHHQIKHRPGFRRTVQYVFKPLHAKHIAIGIDTVCQPIRVQHKLVAQLDADVRLVDIFQVLAYSQRQTTRADALTDMPAGIVNHINIRHAGVPDIGVLQFAVQLQQGCRHKHAGGQQGIELVIDLLNNNVWLESLLCHHTEGVSDRQHADGG